MLKKFKNILLKILPVAIKAARQYDSVVCADLQADVIRLLGWDAGLQESN